MAADAQALPVDGVAVERRLPHREVLDRMLELKRRQRIFSFLATSCM
jgi:hypothetical protein